MSFTNRVSADRRRTQVLAAAAAFAAAAAAVPGRAGAQTWVNPAGGSWATGSNWSAGTAPTSSPTTALTFQAGGSTGYTATNNVGTGTFTLNALTLDNTGTGTITLAPAAAANTLTFAGTTPAINATGTGTTLITAPLVGGAAVTLTKTGTGTVNQQSNSTGFTGTLVVNGGTFASTALATGTYNFNPVSIVVNDGGTYAFGPGGVGNPNLPEGATTGTIIRVNKGGTFFTEVGEVLGGFELNEGTMTMAADAGLGARTTQLFAGTIAGQGGIRNLNNAQAIRKSTAGTVTITDVNLNNTGGLAIEEGVLSTNAGLAGGTTATLPNNISFGAAATAGTLRYTGATAAIIRPIVANAGGGTFEVTQAGTTVTASGPVTGAGPLTKAGDGTLVLSGALSQAGALAATGGTLALTGALNQTGTITAAGGGTVRVNPVTSTGGFAVRAGGTLSLNSGAGTASLNIPSLDLGGANSTLSFGLSGSAVPAVPLVNVSGGLSAAGGTTVVVSPAQQPALGRYVLIDYAGAAVGSGLTLAPLPGRTTAALEYDAANTQVALNVTGTDSVRWVGAVDQTWDAGTAVNVGGTNNFRLVQAGTSTNFIATDNAVFDDVAPAGGRTVNVPGAVRPSSVTVDTADGYTFQGAGGIGGSAVLTKRGAGALTLATAGNTYTGGTTVEAGALRVGAGGTAGTLPGDVAVAVGARLEFNRSDAVTFAGQVTGTKSGDQTASAVLAQTGTGVLTLASPASAFTGTVELNAGTLSVAGFDRLGAVGTTFATSAGVAFNGGTLQVTATTSTGTTAQRWQFNGAGGTVEVTGTASATKQGNSVFGSGPLTKTGTGTLAVGSNGSTFNGPVTVNAGVLEFTSNQFQQANGVTVNPGGAYRVRDDVPGTFNFGVGTALTLNGAGPGGAGAFQLTDQTPAGAAGGPVTTFPTDVALATDSLITATNGTAAGRASTLILTGPVYGDGRLTKGGNGTLALTNAGNAYGGGTTVSAGTLLVNNPVNFPGDSGTGSGPVGVSAGATVGGTGTIAGRLTVAGTVSPGAGVGRLTAGGATLAAGGSYLFEVADATGAAGTGYDVLQGPDATTLTAAGTPAAPFVIRLASLAGTAAGPAANFDPTQAYTFAAAQFPGGVTGFNPAGFTVDPSGFTNALAGGRFSVAASGTGLNVVFTPVPEPGMLGLAGTAAAGLLACRRRRRLA